MRIGEFARAAGVSASAIRFYEKRGLIPSARRQTNGYRSYDAGDLSVLTLIQQARSLGFSLRDVTHFMRRSPEERRDKSRLLPILEQKLAALNQHLAAIQRQRADLLAFMRQIGAKASKGD